MRPASTFLSRGTCLAVLLVALPALPSRGDAVVVPGGVESVRRLLDIPTKRPQQDFFPDLHRTLLALSNPAARWSESERRVAVVAFAEDLVEWRSGHGCPATLSTKPAAWKQTRRALSWLGVKVRGEGATLELEPEADADALRRQAFLRALDVPLPVVLRRLRKGEDVTVPCADGEADLPFGLAAWRDVLDLDPDELSRENAFLTFVREVPASRMLVALHAVDGRTRDEARRLVKTERGTAGGWRLLFDRALDGFTRFPEALVLRDGAFQLPGGPDADAVWSDVVGTSTSDRARFLTALFEADGGKAAYVVDALRQLPPAAARSIVLGKSGTGERAVKRFRRLYGSVERAGGNFERSQRDPYDFTHLVRFLKLSDDGEIVVPGGAALWLEALSGSRFPTSEAELAELLADARRRKQSPEELLRRLFRREVSGVVRDVPAQKRFLLVSGLVESRPVLQDPGTVLLLFRGLERFLPAFAPLEDLPLDDPAMVRRYLFTLDRLDTQGVDREDEVRAGLFLASAELLAAAARSGALTPERTPSVFDSLLALPLFAAPETSPGDGIEAFAGWLHGTFLASLRAEESAHIEAVRTEKAAREVEYREAVARRDGQIVERRASERAALEAVRAEAQARYDALLTVPCASDDAYPGPWPVPAVVDADWLASELETEALVGRDEVAPRDELAIATDRALARFRAVVLVYDALQALRQKARPLPPAPPLERLEGELPGVRPAVDDSLPLPTLVRVAVPSPAANDDELLSGALTGFRRPVLFSWRGARWTYDAARDGRTQKGLFIGRQRGTRLDALSRASAAIGAARVASAAADVPRVREALDLLGSALAAGAPPEEEADPRVAAVSDDAQDALEDLRRLAKPKALAKLPERLGPIQALRAERALEALVLHVYTVSATDPEDLVWADPLFVRRHSFRWSDPTAGVFESPFGPTRIEPLGAGRGSRIAGALSGVPDALGLLHVEQLVVVPQPALGSEAIKTGLLGPVVRVTPARLDDDALRFVALSCDATEELARDLEPLPAQERQEAWSGVSRDLVPQARLGAASAAPSSEIGAHLSPSDLFRIGRRLALADPGITGARPAGPAAAAARDAWQSLRAAHGEAGASARLAEFGPRPASYAGLGRLADLDMPSYERFSEYRYPQLYADRHYDVKVAAARLAFRAGDPAALLALYVAPSLDALLQRVRTAHVYDWRPLAFGAAALGPAQRDALLEAALERDRIRRAEDEEPPQ